MESLPVEIKFAQNLAGNEAKTRLKAVKKLKKYLRAKSASKKDGFSYEDFLKLWKGLHYCMWMQDKPLLQEELNTTLTHLVHDLSTLEAKMMFVKVFFITEAREWNSIDIWRLDKFMMMVRNMLYESLMVMKKLKWDKNKLEGLTQMFCDTVMNPDSDTIPDGLKIHFCDIYLEEVEKAGESQLTGSQLLLLLVPFIKFMQKAKNATLLKRVTSCVFDPVVTRIADEIRMKQTQNTENGDAQETDDIPFLTLKFDGKLISDHIFRVSQEDGVLGRNRPMLYGIVKKLQDIHEGVLPQQREVVIPEGVTNQDVRHAVNSLMNLDGQKDRKKKQRKKKNKKEKHSDDSGVNENADPNNNGVGGSDSEMNQMPSASHVGGKRKHTATEDGAPLTKIKKKKLESENKSEDSEKKTFKKLKNKFSKLDVMKGKKDKKLDIENKTEVETQSKKKGKCNSINRSVPETPVSVQKTEKDKADVSNSEINDTTKAISISAEVPSSMKKSTDKKSPGTLKKKGKRTHSQSKSHDSSANDVQVSAPSGHIAGIVPDIVVQEPTPKIKLQTPTSKSPANSEDLQNGEIEIWVPNKKYKGNKDTSTPKSNFAAFDHSKPPAAFVKRSLSKSLKRTPSSLKTPGSNSKTGSAKRVSFDMKKNKAQGFKESLDSPMTPFNPAKKPDSGILKSPASATAVQGQGSKKVTAKNTNITLETPVTRQVTSKVVVKKKSIGTPVVSIGFQRKKATPMRRQRAADFFL